MGQQLACRLRLRNRAMTGKAWLEADHVLFRGDERVKIPFKDIQSVQAAAGVLRLDFDRGPASFELGKAAEKWADKILHPPTRAAKLGVKPGTTVKLIGDFDRAFVEELHAAGAQLAAASTDLIFCAAETSAALKKVPKPNAALWIVYPKGVPQIREIEVLAAGRAAGLKDVKVASFSPTHTALKFVRPAR